MTTPGNLICSKCGYANVPGDQFCGSCGTFLEYSGVVATDPGPALDPGPTTDPGPIPGPPPGVTTTPPVTPGPGPAGALIRCPTCGIANPPDRTFCQSCGSKLADAGRVTSATPEQIAAAVNQGPVVRTTTAQDMEQESDSGGRTKALIALCVVGVLLGIGVIVGYSLMRGGAATEASPNPSTTASGGSSPLPTGSAAVEPTGSAPAGSTDEPTSSAEVPAVELAINDVNASSSAPNFPVSNVHDGDDQTAWKEGVRSEGRGESITLQFDPATVTAIVVSNGFSKDETSYLVNPRVRAIDVSVNGRRSTRIVLEDTPDRTTYELDAPIDGATTLKITIVSVYPGEDSGGVRARPSTALGEVVVMGVTTP